MLDRPPRSPSDGHAAGVPVPLVSVTAAPTGRSLARPTPEKIYAGRGGLAAVNAAAGVLCGPTALVGTVASALVELGHEAQRIKTERFGPSGGTA